MRTKHTYICIECGKEYAKDWAYKPGHDDDPARCDACFDRDRQAVVESVKDGVATMRDQRTGMRWQIPATAVKAH
jgi:DNA-directed RNA polymerase subunit RPC12/RpoP